MNINVRIGRLILDGLPVTRSQESLVQSAVETELARLLAAEGLAKDLRRGDAVPSVRGRSVELTGISDPSHLGRQIARAVQGAIGK